MARNRPVRICRTKQNPGPRRNKEHTHGEARLLCKHSDLSLISLPDKRRRVFFRASVRTRRGRPMPNHFLWAAEKETLRKRKNQSEHVGKQVGTTTGGREDRQDARRSVGENRLAGKKDGQKT